MKKIIALLILTVLFTACEPTTGNNDIIKPAFHENEEKTERVEHAITIQDGGIIFEIVAYQKLDDYDASEGKYMTQKNFEVYTYSSFPDIFYVQATEYKRGSYTSAHWNEMEITLTGKTLKPEVFSKSHESSNAGIYFFRLRAEEGIEYLENLTGAFEVSMRNTKNSSISDFNLTVPNEFSQAVATYF